MHIEVRSTAAKWGIFLAAIAAAAAISISTLRIWTADRWDRSDDPKLWERAANLEPGNALYWEHLGRYREFDFDQSDPKLAITFFKRATQVDPGYDRLWMELAEAEERDGQYKIAQEDFEDARDTHLTSAEVRWRFGNFLVRRGDRDWGFNEIGKAVSNDSSLTPNAIAVAWDASHSVAEVLGIAPENSEEFYNAAMNFFLGRGEVKNAVEVWNRIAGDGEYFQMQRALPLVNALVAQGDAEVAAKTWTEAVKVSGWEHDPSVDASLVFNSGFEHDIANGGLDWREIAIPGAEFMMDKTSPHSGMQSLKIAFDGSANLAFSNLEQYVPVKPNQKYEFSAYLKTEGITTDSGMRISVNSAAHPEKIHATTQAILGTSDWTNVHLEITTGPNADFLLIALVRDASAKLDNKLAGFVWIDDVTLRPATDARNGRAQ